MTNLIPQNSHAGKRERTSLVQYQQHALRSGWEVLRQGILHNEFLAGIYQSIGLVHFLELPDQERLQ